VSQNNVWLATSCRLVSLIASFGMLCGPCSWRKKQDNLEHSSCI